MLKVPVTVHNQSEEVPKRTIYKVIAASSAGNMIEWYDFFIFGSLSTVLSGKFYQTGTPLGDVLAWLAAFSVGFIVRPFGALFFGKLGDMVGRKFTFLITISMMGLSTFVVGLLPTIHEIGPAAGLILIVLRIFQGLSLGGEYSGAATYIAEFSPNKKRGLYTSFLQATASGGLLLSLGTILLSRQLVGEEAFNQWGWRIPFLISIILVLFSFLIRYRLHESPLFLKLKAKGKVSKHPIRESFTNPINLKWVMLAIFGATMGQGVIWYTGHFYTLFYLQKIFHVPLVDSNSIMAVVLLCGMPFYVLFGWLSDKIGRKPVMLSGMLLAVSTYIPIYRTMEFYHETASYNPFMLGVLIFVQVLYAAMVYGPIAAFLVELFPTKIRYTSMALPYHIGNGIVGGLVPIIGLAMIDATGDHITGLHFPIAIAAVSFIIGLFFIKETKDIDINQEYNNR